VEEDDVGMNVMISPAATTIAFSEAVEAIWLEADLLDRCDYDAWLAMWTPTGFYIVPTDIKVTSDYGAHLNHAFDDGVMRRMRVDRLVGGHAISSTPAARTVRTMSRFRIEEAGADVCVIRSGMHLFEYKFERQRIYAADVTYRLKRVDGVLKLDEKVVRFVNAADALGSLSYLP